MINITPKIILRFCAVSFFFAGFSAASFATPLEVAWTADLNITSATFHSIIETRDGGFLLAGNVTSMTLLYEYVPTDCGILVKTDKSGHVTWTARVFPIEEKLDYWLPWSKVRSALEAQEGGIILLWDSGIRWIGPGWPLAGSQNMIIGRANSDGTPLFRDIIGTGSEPSSSFDMTPLEGGGYVVLGGQYKDGDGNYVLIRLDATGKMLDSKPFRHWGGEGGNSTASRKRMAADTS